MARPTKPTRIDWGNSGSEPSGAKKSTGHSTSEVDKPTADQFNWFWKKLTDIQDFVGGPIAWNVIIDSDANEGNYPTLAAYIDDSPAAGDRVLLKVDEALATDMIIPAGITLGILDGKKFTSATNLTSAIAFSGGAVIVGKLQIDFSHTGTTTNAVLFNGDADTCPILEINNTSTGTITNAINLVSGKKKNAVGAATTNTGGGTITNQVSDNSGNDLNVALVNDGVRFYRSAGAKVFESATSAPALTAKNTSTGAAFNAEATGTAVAFYAAVANGNGYSTVVSGTGKGVSVTAGNASAIGVYSTSTNGKAGQFNTADGTALEAIRSGTGKAIVADGPCELKIPSVAAKAITMFDDAAGTLSQVTPGVNDDVMTMVAGVPAFQTPAVQNPHAYYAGQMAVQNTWYAMVGPNATDDWRGKRVVVFVAYDASDPSDWWGGQASTSGPHGGVLAAGVASDLVQVAGANTLEVRANATTGVLEVRRTGTNNNYNYVVVQFVNNS